MARLLLLSLQEIKLGSKVGVSAEFKEAFQPGISIHLGIFQHVVVSRLPMDLAFQILSAWGHVFPNWPLAWSTHFHKDQFLNELYFAVY